MRNHQNASLKTPSQITTSNFFIMCDTKMGTSGIYWYKTIMVRYNIWHTKVNTEKLNLQLHLNTMFTLRNNCGMYETTKVPMLNIKLSAIFFPQKQMQSFWWWCRSRTLFSKSRQSCEKKNLIENSTDECISRLNCSSHYLALCIVCFSCTTKWRHVQQCPQPI